MVIGENSKACIEFANAESRSNELTLRSNRLHLGNPSPLPGTRVQHHVRPRNVLPMLHGLSLPAVPPTRAEARIVSGWVGTQAQVLTKYPVHPGPSDKRACEAEMILAHPEAGLVNYSH